MDNTLPSQFDLIIIGTGIIESIVSAAASRIGKSVLQIDSNDYYGGQCASFNLEAFHNLKEKLTRTFEIHMIPDTFVTLGNNWFSIKNFNSKWHIPNKLDHESTNRDIDKALNDNNEEAENVKEERHLYSQEDLLKQSRKFNIDLSPKLHFCRGDFVELLISSNISRYAEYRSVSRILTVLNGKLTVVPCSRNDVFADSNISMLEKRILMKLLTSVNNDEFKSMDNPKKTFYDFLEEKQLTHKLISFVLYAIAQGTSRTSCKDGIESCKKFINSLGRFGKTPFLFSMYGSGETAQAFCRLSAVFGGVFALNQKNIDGLVVDRSENCDAKALKINNQILKAEHFLIGIEHTCSVWAESFKIDSYIARAVFITDRSIMPSEQEHLTLLMYPTDDNESSVTIIETGTLTGTCPKNLYLVHFIAKQNVTPEQDFGHIVYNLFDNGDDSKPRILWSCYFSLPYSDLTDNIVASRLANYPSNVRICRGPSFDLDYDSSIKEAKEIFHSFYPDQEFLPRAPDPEEIIFGDETNSDDASK